MKYDWDFAGKRGLLEMLLLLLLWPPCLQHVSDTTHFLVCIPGYITHFFLKLSF